MEKKIIPEVNRSVFEIIENLDAAPEKARPVTFWLYSGTEGNFSVTISFALLCVLCGFLLNRIQP